MAQYGSSHRTQKKAPSLVAGKKGTRSFRKIKNKDTAFCTRDARVRDGGKTIVFHELDHDHSLRTNHNDKDVTLIGYTTQSPRQPPASHPGATPVSSGTLDTSAVVRLDKGNAELSFWHRAAHVRHLCTALLSCDVDLTCVDLDYPLLRSHEKDNKSDYQLNSGAFSSDTMSVGMQNTLKSFGAMSEDRLHTALQSLLDLSSLIYLHSRQTEDAAVCYQNSDHLISHENNCHYTNISTSCLNANADLKYNNNTAHEVHKTLDLRECTERLPLECHDGLQHNSNAPDTAIHSSGKPIRFSAMHGDDDKSDDDDDDDIRAYCSWVNAEHYSAVIALAQLSEAAIPPRGPSLLLSTISLNNTSNALTQEISGEISDDSLMSNKEHYDLDPEDNNLTSSRPVPTLVRRVQGKQVIFVPSPVLYSAVRARMSSVRRLWQLRFTFRVLMPAIRSCGSVQTLNNLLFAHSPAAIKKMSYHSSDDISAKHNSSGVRHSRLENVGCQITAGPIYLLLPHVMASHTSRPKASSAAASTHNILCGGQNAKSNSDEVLQTMCADGVLPLLPPHLQHRYESEVLLALIRAANDECDVDREVWGSVCGGDEHSCITDLRVAGGTYIVQHAVRQTVMARLLEQAELYGLPPFLRSIRRVAQTAVVRRSDAAMSPDVWGDFFDVYMPGMLVDEVHTAQDKSQLGERSNDNVSSPATMGPSSQYPYHFFLTPSALDSRSFNTPDALQGQVVQEEIINLIMSQCCFGMLVGEADQIVFLVKAVNEFFGARRLRRGECKTVKKEELPEEPGIHDPHSSSTTDACASSCTALRDPLAPYVRKALLSAKQPYTTKRLVLGNDSNTERGDLQNDWFEDRRQISCCTTAANTTNHDSGITLNRLSVTWLCDNRWSRSISYYALIFCVGMEDELEAVEEGTTEGCPVDVEAVPSSIDTLRPLREATYHLCSVVELTRQT